MYHGELANSELTLGTMLAIIPTLTTTLTLPNLNPVLNLHTHYVVPL